MVVNTRIKNELQGSNGITTEDTFSKNIGPSERIISVGTGVLITLSGIAKLFKSPFLALTQIGIGAVMLDRGISGYCIVKRPFNRTEKERPSSTDPAPLSTAESNTQSTVIDAIELGSGSNTKHS